MKVIADSAPRTRFSVGANPKNPSQTVVRFFENIQEHIRETGERTYRGWEYDEYQLIVPRCGENDVQMHFDEWLIEAKAAEKTPQKKLDASYSGMESLLGHEQTRQEALELRRALQLFVQSTVPVDDESKAMEYASIYPTWEELLATKQTYPAKTIFSWGTTDGGDKQLWSFISDYQPQEIYTPDQDISHYKQVGITEDGYEVWTQPLCAEDAYHIGDIAYHIDGLWKCTQGDAAGLNVWEPGVFGWERYTPGETDPEEPDPEEPVEPSQYPAWEEMTTGTALHVGDYFTYQGKTYKVLREMTVTPGWEPPALLNDYYEEVAA